MGVERHLVNSIAAMRLTNRGTTVNFINGRIIRMPPTIGGSPPGHHRPPREKAMIQFEQALQTVEDFCRGLDTGTLLATEDGRLLRAVRSRMIAALSSLLVWHRPALERGHGIDWPYRRMRMVYPLLAAAAEREGDAWRKRQTLLCLALLPFPRQWQWLDTVRQLYGQDPELAAFLAAERSAIREKMGDKPQRSYKLRHFLQVLKKPRSHREKGVLRIFSLPYLFALHSRLLERLSERYVLYVEPPMGIVFRHAWWRCFAMLQDPVVFGVAAREDMRFLRQQTGVVPIAIAHGDFLEELQRPPDHPEQKDYDIVFNATYDDMRRKRHELMLHLLLDPLLQNVRLLCLGRGEATNVAGFRQQAADLGLQERVAVMANLRRAEVPEQLSRCRMGVHLSLYENGCRSIYEFFRADLPCVIASSMGGVNLSIFNIRTGKAVPDAGLAAAIAAVLRERRRYRPREWFLRCSGSANSSRRLNEILRRLFRQWGYQWSEDIVQLGSSGASRYVHADDYAKFRDEFVWLLKIFTNLRDESWTFTLE